MSPLLIAKQGFGGGLLAVALMGFTSIAPPVVKPAAPDFIGGGGTSLAQYKVDDDRYEIPVSFAEDEDEETVIMSILMEIAVNEL